MKSSLPLFVSLINFKTSFVSFLLSIIGSNSVSCGIFVGIEKDLKSSSSSSLITTKSSSPLFVLLMNFKTSFVSFLLSTVGSNSLSCGIFVGIEKDLKSSSSSSFIIIKSSLLLFVSSVKLRTSFAPFLFVLAKSFSSSSSMIIKSSFSFVLTPIVLSFATEGFCGVGVLIVSSFM